MPVGNGARFEFRVWGDSLDAVGDRLRAQLDPAGDRESVEIYLVLPGTVDVNPKVRAGLLDIKTLVEEREGFQRWDVLLKSEFPVKAGVVAELFAAFHLAAPPPHRESYSLPELLAEVAELHPQMSAVEVAKRRQLGTMGPCLAEITVVVIGEREMETVALESTDLSALREARHTLGLAGHDNVSYPQAIHAVLAAH